MLLRSGRRVATGEEAARAAVPRRRIRTKPNPLAGIPEEILQEILVRLPAKSVLRYRAVCRSWRRLASSPAFLLDHHRHQPELHLINSYRTVDGVHDLYPALEAVHLRGGAELRPVFGFPDLFHTPLTVDASCDGLFVAGSYICNPATRQWAPLSSDPKRRVPNLVALYRHQPSGEYRVLYWTHSSAPLTLPVDIHPNFVLCPNEYRVLTVGTDESRLVDCPLTKMIGARGPIICGAPVFIDGSLHVHWKMRSAVRYHKILVFDTVAETFRHMIPPAVNPRHAMHLLHMGGTLAAATTKDGMAMTIFVLQDHEQDVWAFQYRIKLPVMDIRRFQEQGDWWAKVVSEEGDVLVTFFGQLLHCDKRGNFVANYKFDNEIPVVIPHTLKESLIQHTFFQNKTKKN